MWYQTVGDVFLILGAVIFFIAGVGLHWLKDPYTRASSVGTAAGLGVALIAGGAALHVPEWSVLIKVAIAIVLQLWTSAVGSIMIARAAVMSGHSFYEDTKAGELDDDVGTHATAKEAAQRHD